MRVISLKRLTLDGEPLDPDTDIGPSDWWCVIETKEEEMAYDNFLMHLGSYDGAGDCDCDCRDILWNRLVIHAGQGMGVHWGDDDMYGYIRPDETAPEIGEEYVDFVGDRWVRTE